MLNSLGIRRQRWRRHEVQCGHVTKRFGKILLGKSYWTYRLSLEWLDVGTGQGVMWHGVALKAVEKNTTLFSVAYARGLWMNTVLSLIYALPLIIAPSYFSVEIERKFSHPLFFSWNFEKKFSIYERFSTSILCYEEKMVFSNFFFIKNLQYLA